MQNFNFGPARLMLALISVFLLGLAASSQTSKKVVKFKRLNHTICLLKALTGIFYGVAMCMGQNLIDILIIAAIVLVEISITTGLWIMYTCFFEKFEIKLRMRGK